MNKPEFVPTCETCRFRLPDDRPEYPGAGHCRRYPPSIAVWDGIDTYERASPTACRSWPWMKATDFCGEWAAAQSQPAAEPVDVREALAHALWFAEAQRAMPQQARARTLQAFADESDETRAKWLFMANAAERALRTPAREVSDSEVADVLWNTRQWHKESTLRCIRDLRAHNMAIAYRKEPSDEA